MNRIVSRIIAVVLIVGATLLTANCATAQGSLVKVEVPFAFTVNNAYLPAGTYLFGFDSAHPELLVIRDGKYAIKAWDFGQPETVSQGNPHALIFHRYDNQYFLSEVRLSASEGIELSAAKSEKRARRVNRNGELASIAAY